MKDRIRDGGVVVENEVLVKPALLGYLKQHSLIYFIGRSITGMINLLSISILARLLTADGYGLFTLVLSGVFLANAALFQWLRIAIVRHLPAYREGIQNFISVVLSICISESIIIFLISMLFIWFFQHYNKIAIIFILILLTHGWFDLNLELVRANLKPIQYGTLLAGKTILSLLLSVLFVWLGWGTYGALVGQLIGLLIIGGIAYRSLWRGIKPKFQYQLARKFVVYGFPISLSLLFSSLLNYLDRFLIAFFMGQRSAGIYAAIYDLTSAILFFIMQIPVLAGFPLAVHAYQKEDRLSCQQILRETYLISLRYSLPLAGILLGLSYPLVLLALGADFAQAHSLLRWLCPALIVYGLLEHYYNRSFWITGATWQLVSVMGVSAGINIILNIIFIPIYGLAGAAVATLAAYIMATAMSAMLARHTFPLPSLLPDLPHLLIAFGVLEVILFLTSSWRGVALTMARAALGIGVYWISIMILSGLHRGRSKSTSREAV